MFYIPVKFSHIKIIIFFFFQTKKHVTGIFPPFELYLPIYFILSLQLPKQQVSKYSIEANFYGDYTPSHYSVRTQNIIWE
ncbi:MAG: hypothetical protein D8H95_47735 [Lachnospiraceae bacterium]|nr:MAG: hypothetical protein D8H95_47735 [Lachnospiraceae bacterium]